MTATKDVRGLYMDGQMVSETTVTVRATSDEAGQSLSLASDEYGVMLMVAVETVSDILRLSEVG